jgi:hypothetical protein
LAKEYHIKDPSIKESVAKYYPGFNFSTPLTYRQMRGIVESLPGKQRLEEIKKHFPEFDFKKPRFFWEIEQVMNKLRASQRLEEIKSKGLTEGTPIISEKQGSGIIKKISSDGHLILEGRRGSFHPACWEKV